MDYNKAWESMNSLEGTICNACSVREVIETAIVALEERNYKKAEALMNASYQFLKYFIDDFDSHFRVAWDETIGKCKKEDPCMPPWGHSDMEYLAKQPPEDKVLKWQLPIEMDPSGEYFFTLPDDLLDVTGWKEGDQLVWEEKEDGTFLLKQ